MANKSDRSKPQGIRPDSQPRREETGREIVDVTPTTRVPEIEEYRRCPLCWSGRTGYGCAYTTEGQKRYYKCVKCVDQTQSPCGHTWTAIVTLHSVRVEHRTVRLEGSR